jgi:heterotetrameric sarcosine oxidase beta subunit
MTAAAGSSADVADVLIIGAGIMGLATAYNLAARGARRQRVVVIDANYLAWGASGRNGGGVRQQWSTEMNVRLMQESMQICESFAAEMGINVWMRRGGYLFLARTEAAADRLSHNVSLQNDCGLPTRMMAPEEAASLVPELDVRPFVAACYNPTDAIVFPWPFLWGYARAAQTRGVVIRTRTPVTAIGRRAGGFEVETPAGRITAGRVVCAAGAWSPRVAALVEGAMPIPNQPVRHEILSTEPLKPFLKPMVSVIETGLYVSQSLRGELVGGVGLADETAPAGEVRLGSRLAFATAMARGLTDLMPSLSRVKMVRQWAGPYDVTPDGDPIVGELPGAPGFSVVCGFTGHGFMMAPVIARYLVAYLSGDTPHPLFAAWRPDRFAAGTDAGANRAREEMTIG